MGVWQAIAGPIIELIGGWASDRRELKRAELQGRIKYLSTEQGHRHAWEIASIQQSGQGMRWASFAMWSAPFLWAFIDPIAAQAALESAIEALPDWYVAGYLTVTGGVWGIKEFATVRSTTKARNQAKGADK